MIIDDIVCKFGIGAKKVLIKFEGETIKIPGFRVQHNRFVSAFAREFGDIAIAFFERYKGKKIKVNNNIESSIFKSLKRQNEKNFINQYLKDRV